MPRANSTETASALPAGRAGNSLTGRSSIHGRFEPGTGLGQRYRIVSLLGRGGMGEVYRADDLELGQSVALKFLPERVASDPVALDRFRSEVRTARQVAHPNVCRMYDIGEVDGHVFLSMEYIDGEDLAHVLTRMGRPSKEKALEIARQLCLGLAAAHENGVLHRDLKPANIMIDGRGRVRITDFGLAGLADEFSDQTSRAGTPAYMAPEQLVQGSVSVRSDIYSLGLILHEIYTGKRMFETNSIAELRQLHSSATAKISSGVSTSGTEAIDPVVERVIQRCLEHDPQRRPSSVYAVLGALPGGDPLAAALAAGETPSPELLAEMGGAGGLNPRFALALLTAGLALLAVLTWMAPRRSLIGVVSLEKPEDELAIRARDLFKDLTGKQPPIQEESRFDTNQPYLEYLEKNDDWAARRKHLRSQRPPAMVYWHRFSRDQMKPAGLHEGQVRRNNPPLSGPDSALIVFDPQGRLVSLRIIPPRTPQAAMMDAAAVADILFKRAGLDLTQFEKTELLRTPPVTCDAVQAYRGPYGPESGEPIVVQVGSSHGRGNYFEIIESWNSSEEDRADRPFALIGAILSIGLLVAVVVIAHRNLTHNRCDRRGAFRLALFTLVTWQLAWFISSFHVHGSLADTGQLIGYMLFDKPFGHAFAHAFFVWLAYITLEPYARRLWPTSLVTWARLLMGRFRDPQLGRDILVGGLFGGVLVGLGHVFNYVRVQTGQAPEIEHWVLVGGLRWVLSGLVAIIENSVGNPLMQLVALVVLRLILRRNWAAIIVFVLLVMLPVALEHEGVLGPAWSFAVAHQAVWVTLIVVLLIRFGVCAAIAAWFVYLVFSRFAITTDLTQWYAGAALVPVLACVALLGYGFYISLAGKPLWREAILER